MTTPEIYKLANRLTIKEVENIVGYWEVNNETEILRSFNSLVRLGDSKQLACATSISNKYNGKKDNKEFYINAYTN